MSRSKQQLVTLIDEVALERVAYIIGEQSAARQALDDAARRRANGEDPVIVQQGQMFLVIPRSVLSSPPVKQPESEDA